MAVQRNKRALKADEPAADGPAKKRKVPASKASKADKEPAAKGKAAAAKKTSTSAAAAKQDKAKPAANGKRPAANGGMPAASEQPKRQKIQLDPEFAALKGGALYAYGEASMGQLGCGDGGDVETPFPKIATPEAFKGLEVKQVAAGGMHSVVLLTSGKVFTAGVNDEGPLGRPTDGELWNGKAEEVELASSAEWGAVPLDEEVVRISAGDDHTLLLTAAGDVWSCGTYRSSSAVLGHSPAQRNAPLFTRVYDAAAAKDPVVQIDSGYQHSIALTAGGHVLTWGIGENGQLGRISISLRHPKAFEDKKDALVPKRLKLPTSWGRIEGVCAGGFNSFAVAASGRVIAWGLNASGQLGVGSSTLETQLGVGISPFDTRALVWPSDIRLAATGKERHVVHPDRVLHPCIVHSLRGQPVTCVAAAHHHTLFLSQEGQVLSAGESTDGRLGRPTADSDVYCQAEAVHGFESKHIIGIAAGISASCAWAAEPGQIFTWGVNTSWLLGMGSDDSLLRRQPEKPLCPKRLGELKPLQVSIGGQHALVLASSS